MQASFRELTHSCIFVSKISKDLLTSALDIFGVSLGTTIFGELVTRLSQASKSIIVLRGYSSWLFGEGESERVIGELSGVEG